MHKQTAILALTSQLNLSYLNDYLQHHPRVVFVLPEMLNDEICQKIIVAGSQIKIVNLTTISSTASLVDSSLISPKTSSEHYKQSVDQDKQTWFEIYLAVLSENTPLIQSLFNELQLINNSYFIESILIDEETSWFGKSVCAWGNQNSIPTFLLALENFSYESDYFTTYLSNTIVVANELSAEFFLDCGVSNERITVIDYPDCDTIKQLKSEKTKIKRWKCDKLGINNSLPIIGFDIHTPFSFDNGDDQYLQKIIHTFCTMYQLLVEADYPVQLIIINPSPSKLLDAQQADNLAQNAGIPPEYFFYLEERIEDWLVSTDIWLSFDIYSAIKAMLCETPAIQLLTPQALLSGNLLSSQTAILQCEHTQLFDNIFSILAPSLTRDTILAQMQTQNIEDHPKTSLAKLIPLKNRINPGDGLINFTKLYLQQNILPKIKPISSRIKTKLRSILKQLAPICHLKPGKTGL